MTKGETLDLDFLDKFTNLNRNLRLEMHSDVSSSSSDEDFASRIEIDSDEDISSKSDLQPDCWSRNPQRNLKNSLFTYT